jgi:hypothetical protein
MRNFAVVAERITKEINCGLTIEQIKQNELLNTVLYLKHLKTEKSHLISLLYKKLREAEKTCYIDAKSYNDFKYGINLIKKDGLYAAPESHYILWKKLLLLCEKHFLHHSNTLWAKKISNIIKGKE